MKNLLTVSVLLLPFSTNISFANEATGDTQSQANQEQTSSSENGEVLKATSDEDTTSKIGLTAQENEFLAEAEKLSKTSKTPASDLITFMKNKHLRSALAKKLKDYLESFQYKVSEKPGGGVSISYTKDDYIQADDGVNNSYKVARKADNPNIDKHGDTRIYHCPNMSNDDIALRIQNLDKTIRLVSNDIGLLNDSIISTQIKLDGIVHNLNNIIGYIQMTDGYKWQSFLQNIQAEKNNQPPKEYILSMDNLSKTINDMSIVLKQVMEQKAAIQPQIIQQPCQQVTQPQYLDSLNKTIYDLSVMLQQELKRDDSQSNQKCQSCLINEQINKANDDKASREYIESIESLNKTLLNMSEKLNDAINHKHNSISHEQTSALTDFNASLHNISNELQKVASKMDAISDKDVNITVIGQNASRTSRYSSADGVAIEAIRGGSGSVISNLTEDNTTGDNVKVVDTTIAEKAVEKLESAEKVQVDSIKNTDENHDTKVVDVSVSEKIEVKSESAENIPDDSTKNTEETHDAKPVDAHATEKADESQDSEMDKVQTDIRKQEIHPVDDVKNLGIVKQQISEFESIIDSNKGPKAGHNGIINSNSDTSRYNEIKTELEQNVKNEVEDKKLTLSVVPPAPALINMPPVPPALPEVTKENNAILDKDAEKEAAYDRFLEKRRLEREQELRKISGIDGENDSSSATLPPPAPALDLSKVPGAPSPLKINKKSSIGSADSSAPKKLGIVAEMAKRFEALNNGGSQSDHNGIIKKDSHTSGYDKVKKHLKKKHK